ncbi:MAG: SusD/RagB family nutrient-binding outer membrane lipoprotein, partial [Flavisolibacter sp.]|nr:SusD/RagB family nutrient-binding outer membrane lipoprotein [Flavisolibacter sp.]
NTRLNIKQQFQSIVSNSSKYPLMTGNADNFQLVYNKSAINNSYPTFQNLSFSSLVSMEKSFVDLLKARKDPRLFKFAEPVTGKPANAFESYEGVDAGLTVVNQQSSSRNASKPARRYFEDQINEPMIFIGYAEQEFLIAEAIARNWITGAGTAEEHYNKGITASMKFYGINDADITSYLAEPNVKFDPANAIPMIITQKYIAFFMNSFYEPFFEQRRTGIPTLSVGPGTLNGGQVPKRWIYPQSEYVNNKANVQAAVERQYPGGDNVNEVMWVLK